MLFVRVRVRLCVSPGLDGENGISALVLAFVVALERMGGRGTRHWQCGFGLDVTRLARVGCNAACGAMFSWAFSSATRVLVRSYRGRGLLRVQILALAN